MNLLPCSKRNSCLADVDKLVKEMFFHLVKQLTVRAQKRDRAAKGGKLDGMGWQDE